MYKNQRVSIIFPAYNEEENIRAAITEFFTHPAVDEIVVVDNRSSDRTKEEILATKATYVYEARPGYGSALMRGMQEATGDLLVTVEPDGTFRAHDLDKLLIYSVDFDVVFGTRTSRALVWTGAYMPFWVRIGNWAVAKLLEYLFNGPSLTDVGCTYKLIKRTSYERIRSKLTVVDNRFSPHMMAVILRANLRSVEIPVHYCSRIGESKITGNGKRAFVLGARMIWMILRERLQLASKIEQAK